MRELTIQELDVVSGGNKAAIDFIVGWIGGHAADSAYESGTQLIDAGIKEIQSYVEQYNKDHPVDLTQKEIDALEQLLKDAAEEKDQAAVDYCGCGGGYSD